MKIITTTIAILLAVNTLSSQTDNNKENKSDNKKDSKNYAVITGHFTDNRQDTVVFSYYDQKLYYGMAGEMKSASIAKDGVFTIEIPMTENIGYIYVSNGNSKDFDLYEYLIVKGDSIHLEIDPATSTLRNNIKKAHIAFSGRHQQTFPARYKLDSTNEAIIAKLKPIFYSYNEIKEDITVLWNRNFAGLNKSMDRMTGLLAESKDQLEPVLFDILRTDIIYKYYDNELTQFNSEYRASKNYTDSAERRNKMENYYRNHFLVHDSLFAISAKAKQVSRYYTEFLAKKVLSAGMLTAVYRSDNKAASVIRLMEDYPLEIKERLATSVVAVLGDGNGRKDLNELIDYGKQVVRKTNLLSIIEKYESLTKKGSPGYEFALENAKRTMVTQGSLKGKVVLMDFWYTGCRACIDIAKGIKKMKETFKGDTSIVFVSINTDKDRLRWLSSVKSGLYTDDNSMNLYTMGQGNDHPIISYYNISGYPKMMILDQKGKVFSFNPPRPDTNQKFAEDLIRSAKD